VSKLLAAQRQIVLAEAADARAIRAGFSPNAVRVAMLTAYDAWSARMPWRFLPGRIRAATFRCFGGSFSARWVREWLADNG
jgi:hypothetical protein